MEHYTARQSSDAAKLSEGGRVDMSTHRTTRADLARLVARVQLEAHAAGVLGAAETLTLHPGNTRTETPYRLSIDGGRKPFAPTNGNGRDIGKTPHEAEHTLRIMWATLTAARKARE